MGCSKSDSTAQTKTLYTCGMHPQVIQDHPGNCPICGMKLTPVRKQGATTQITNSSAIAVDPVMRQNMGIRTEIISRGPLRRIIRTIGIVEHTESGMADVTTKYKGWVEKLYVDATGQHVHHGDPLFEIYSPELYSAQTEFLLAHSSGNSNDTLKVTARNKLKYMDITEDQIAALEKTGAPSKTLRVASPIDGYVMEKMVVAGQMVDAGMKLYRLVNHDTIWVQAQIYEQDLSYVRVGQDADVTIGAWPDIRFRGRVTFISPTLDEKTRTVMVRMEFHNPGHLLRPGMYATARITVEMSPSVLLVPDMAVLRSGEKNTVFVALDEGRFEPRTVVLGRAAEDDRYEVIRGLREGERVVSSGQFMLDSESRLREGIQKMTEPGAEMQIVTNAPEVTVTNAAPALPEQVVYICPMPEHVAMEYSHPGECSLCAMKLVPVSRELLAKIQPGGTLEGYTCPMREHSDVRQDGPGKCPKCGMTLVPVMSLPKVQEPLESHQLYTCPMASHADVVSDKPGKCTKCEMQLVPTTAVKHGKIAEENWKKTHEH